MQKVKVNTKKHTKLLLLMVIFAISCIDLFSQRLDSPIEPVQIIIRDWEVGAFFGVGANYSSGTYSAICTECNYDDNSKLGWSLGLKSDYEISKPFYLGTNIIFEDLSTRGSFRRYEDVTLKRADSSLLKVPIQFRQEIKLDLFTVGIAPNILWRPSPWFDLRLGFYLDYIVSNNVTHTKELLTKTILLPDGEKVKVSIPNEPDNIVELENQPIPELNPLQYGLFPQINFNINLSKDSDLMLGYYMKIPFSDFGTKQPGYSHNVWRIFMGISFDINDDERKIAVPSDRN